jgi:small subunit ribosomal protein S2
MMIKNGELQEKYSKKEQIKIIKQKDKLEKFFGGIKNNYRKPSLVVVFDSLHEKNAIIESKKAGVPVIALCNTDAGNLSDFEFPIPINTGSIKTVSLMISLLTDAIAEIANLPLLVKGVADDKIELPVVTKTKK